MLGRAVGLMFLSLFGAGWILAGVGVADVENPARLVIQVADALVTAGLLVLGIRLFIDAGRLPRRLSAEGEEHGRRAGRLFGLIFGLEIILIVGVSLILSRLSLGRLILPAIAVIVGIHFLPLAAVFRVRTYYVTGWLLTLLGLVGVVGIVATSAEGGAWGAGVAFSVGVALWATGLLIALQARSLYAPNGWRS